MLQRNLDHDKYQDGPSREDAARSKSVTLGPGFLKTGYAQGSCHLRLSRRAKLDKVHVELWMEPM